MKSSSARKLNTMIAEYGYQKQQLKELKDSVEKLNDAIKEIMVEEELSEYETDDWKIKYYVSERVTMDEEMLIDILKQHKVKGVIKKREYVDEHALESLIFHDKLDKKVVMAMDKAREVKEIQNIRISEVK